MKQLLLATLAMLSAAVSAAPQPTSGTFSDSTSLLNFVGGPFMVPNLASDSVYLGSSEPSPLLICRKQAMNCDRFNLTVALSEPLRNRAAQQKQVLHVSIKVQEQRPLPLVKPDFHLYVFDASGTELAHSRFGSDDSLERAVALPLNSIPNGSYTIIVTGYNGLGASYSAEVGLGLSQ